MPEDDAWDWKVLLYVGTVILRRSEAQFWRMTPRKLNALTRAYVELKSPKDGTEQNKPKTAFIDQIM